jgi:hypothetical protein
MECTKPMASSPRGGSGRELWPLEDMIRNCLDRLSVKAFPVIGPAIAEPTPLLVTPVAVPMTPNSH